MDLTPAELATFAARPKAIDYAALETLPLIGRYRRDLPVSMARMMENALDWEHLPHVHPGSFADIVLAEGGSWGWRAKAKLPGGQGAEQLVELLLDAPGQAWVTTIVAGMGEGIRIHTIATQRAEAGIAIDVRFHLPAAPDTPGYGEMVLGVLRSQYTQLYDEDEALMVARQQALDGLTGRRVEAAPAVHDFGPEAALPRDKPHPFRLGSGAFVARYHEGAWIAHAAICPHMLGPLDQGAIRADGLVMCPWHGYRFSLADGGEVQGRCGPLPRAPELALVDDHLVATVRPHTQTTD